MKHFIFYILIFITGISQAQDTTGMIKYTPDYELKDGLYLKFQQLQQNNPIPKSRIITTYPMQELDFFEQVLQDETIKIYDALGAEKEIPVDNIWGYCNRGKVFVNHNNAFNRIPFLGNVAHFVSNVTVHSYNSPYHRNPYYYNRYYDPYYTGNTSTSEEMRQYVLDFETGNIYQYNMKTVETILMRDPELYDEFIQLRRRKKNKLMFFYLRKYNKRNPLYLPKN
jgi:hypothetical protein